MDESVILTRSHYLEIEDTVTGKDGPRRRSTSGISCRSVGSENGTFMTLQEDETGGGGDLSTELDQVSNSDYISQQKI